ncbi:MAG: thiol-activated cytolysin family protein, partial [Polyangiaceae bacterium]
ALAIAFAGLAACGGGSNGAGPSDAQGPSTADAGSLDDGEGLSAYLQSLPAWPDASPDADVPAGDAGTASVLSSDNKSYACTRTPYSLTTTPQQIVTFDPNVDVLWPGALLQGKALQSGALAGLPITQRAPIAISIPGLLAANNTITVGQPTLATVQQAIGQLINAAVTAGIQPSSSISYNQTTAYSMSQAALDLGLSVNYLGFDLNSTFDYSSDVSVHTVVGSFTQKMFTVAVPEPEQPSDFFSGLTQEELNAQIAAGNIGPDNLPVYVASVTYGRILMFSITSTASASDISGALDAQYKGAVGGASGSVDYKSLVQNSSTQIKVVTVGGAASNAEAMIESGDPTKFFTSDPALTTGVPISYTLRNLGNNSVAAVSETTSYDVQKCQESSAGVTANYYVVSGGTSVQTFYSKGNAQALSMPITGLSGAGGIAYDYRDDELFVTTGSGAAAGIAVFGADGTPVSLPGANWSLSEPASQIEYDPQYARLYVVEPGADVKAFTPQGQLQETYPLLDARSAAFDAADGELFVTFASAPLIEAYKLSGSLVPLMSGAFPGLAAPILGYDPNHDHVIVADSGNVSTFLPDGTLAASAALQSAASAVVYDDNDDEIAATIPSQGIVTVLTWDLKPAAGIVQGGFSNLTQPSGIVYRP